MPGENPAVMLLGDGQDRHAVGAEDCAACWRGYPEVCDCGGLIHASYGDESASGDYWLYTRCDRCGESE